MNQDKTFLGTEPIGKLLRQLAVPTVIAQLVNMLYNIVDRIYIGHIPGNGDLARTGVGVGRPLLLIVSAFAAARPGRLSIWESRTMLRRRKSWAAALPSSSSSPLC